MLAAGRLRERITIRRPVNVKTAAGGQQRNWETVASNLPAEVLGGGSSEAVIAARLEGTSTFRITVRHGLDVRASDQILWNGLELNVLGPPFDPTGRRQMLQIVADTSAAQGA